MRPFCISSSYSGRNFLLNLHSHRISDLSNTGKQDNKKLSPQIKWGVGMKSLTLYLSNYMELHALYLTEETTLNMASPTVSSTRIGSLEILLYNTSEYTNIW